MQETENNNKAKLVIVNSEAKELVALKKAFDSETDFDVEGCSTYGDAICLAKDNDLIAIFIDMDCLEIDATEMASMFSESINACNIPLVFMSHTPQDFFIQAKDSKQLIDYMTKPVEPNLLMARAKTFSWVYHEKKLFHRQTVEKLERTHEKLKESNRELLNLALLDPLTNLANRRAFEHEINKVINYTKRKSQSFALLVLDIDHFKSINDSLGHDVGDVLLKKVADHLKKSLRNYDFIARLGGDEFAVILKHLERPHQAGVVAAKIKRAFEEACHIEGNELFVQFSIGIACFGTSAFSVNEMIKNADIALYRAKNAGRNRFEYFSDKLNAECIRRLEVEELLHQALQNEEFHMVYQPIISFNTKSIVGMEALLRWNNPKLGLIPPDEFIPIAEEVNLIVPIGEWVIKTVFRQLAQWDEHGFRNFNMTINLSAKQMMHENFYHLIEKEMAHYKLQAQWIELEITDIALLHYAEQSEKELGRLRGLGLQISMDAFGVGYSALERLRQLPVTTLKINRELVATLTDNQTDLIIVESMINLAHNLNFNTIAEGVETKEQESLLISMGCHWGQGYFYSEPVEPELLEHYLQSSSVAHNVQT